MSDDHVPNSVHTTMPVTPPENAGQPGSSRWSASGAAPLNRSHRLFRLLWHVVGVLLLLAICAAIYSVGWEYSTRRYLKGFSDAIVPATAPGDEKIEAVLNWMEHGPTRLPYGPSPNLPDRDPTDTLNYDALLQVCGTATNAFINLMDTGGMGVRRLLLVDSKHDDETRGRRSLG